MQRIRVFLNPRASSGERADLIEGLRRKLFRSDLEFVAPDGLEALRAELERAVRDKVDALVAVGGDGTANTLIQTLAGSEVGLLLVPAGTANDLAREIGMDGRIEKAVHAVRTSSARWIDLIKINGRYMATNGGVGLGAAVAIRINEWRSKVPGFKALMRLAGPNIYSAVLGTKLFSPSGGVLKLRAEIDGVPHEFLAPILMISNQPALGGNFTVAPDTHNDDGTFNVAVFGHRSRLRFLKGLLDIRQGKDPRTDPEFSSFEARRVRIETDGTPIPFFGDGEFLCEDRVFDIEIVPRGLKLFSPLPDPFRAVVSKEPIP